jgi:peptidoglycan-associated lipoprotein
MKKLAVIAVVVMMAACNPTKKDGSATNQDNTKTTATTSTTSGPDVSSKTQEQSVYFEFAKSAIDPQYNSAIQQDVDAAKGQKHTVRLEGNCDERGSAEYNLGLGQRRADAVKKRMVAAGIPARQIKAVSLGKEKPKASCHDESCWKENRRVDFVQQG